MKSITAYEGSMYWIEEESDNQEAWAKVVLTTEERKTWQDAQIIRTVNVTADREPASLMEALTGQHGLWAKSITFNPSGEEK